jgi:hypothetical protein
MNYVKADAAVSHVAAMAKVTLNIPAPAHVEEDCTSSSVNTGKIFIS